MPKVREPQYIPWIFTLNANEHYELDAAHVRQAFIKKLKKVCTEWTFQLERGLQTKRLHYQGRFCFASPTRKQTILNKFKLWNKGECLTIEPEYHQEGHTKYIHKKDETYVAGPWSHEDFKEMPNYVKTFYLDPWMETVLASAHFTDLRTINYIYDPVGNSAKSLFGTYLHCNNLGLYVDCDTSKDMISYCYSRSDKKLYYIDMERTFGGSIQQIYNAVERLKNGRVYDPRFSYRERFLMDRPAVWIVANRLPMWRYLSADRWKVWVIGKDKKLVPYDALDTEQDSSAGAPAPDARTPPDRDSALTAKLAAALLALIK